MKLRTPFMNSFIDLYSQSESISKIMNIIESKKTGYQVSINASKVNMLEQDKKLKIIIDNADVINADGISTIIGGRLLGTKIPERVSGIDIFLELLEISEEKNYSVYFIGAKQATLDKMKTVIKEKFPKLNMLGSHHGYFSENEHIKILEEINDLKPDLIFLGFSSPKKEYWIGDNIELLPPTFIMGVGGSFDVLAGDKKRAPLFIQKIGLEWLFRFIQEPIRLFERYFIGNFKFLRLLIRYLIKVK